MMNTADRLREILENHPGIRQAVVFGSVASGKANLGSDLDIAIEAERPLSAAQKMRLIEDLAAAIGRPVDLIDLKTAGEPLLGQILQHGQRILGSNTDYAALIRRHLFDAEDFLPYAQRMLHERKRAWTS
jgi:predicted nucleotidyltransferase